MVDNSAQAMMAMTVASDDGFPATPETQKACQGLLLLSSLAKPKLRALEEEFDKADRRGTAAATTTPVPAIATRSLCPPSEAASNTSPQLLDHSSLPNLTVNALSRKARRMDKTLGRLAVG